MDDADMDREAQTRLPRAAALQRRDGKAHEHITQAFNTRVRPAD